MAPESPVVTHWDHSEEVLLPLLPAKGPVLKKSSAAL